MAARTEAGTGVVVSLVVFVLSTIFLLVLTIVFYARQSKEIQAAVEAEESLAKYVTREQRNRDEIKALEGRANPAAGQSVVRMLQDDKHQIMQYLTGNGSDSLDTARDSLMNFGVGEGETVREILRDLSRDQRTKQQEIGGLESKLANRQDEIDDLKASMRQLEEDHRAEVDGINTEVNGYRTEALRNRDRLDEAEGEYRAAVDRLDDRYQGEIADLQNQNDRLNEESVRLKDRVGDLQAIIARSRPTGGDPSLLVDGHIIDQAGSSDAVFIDRGKKHHIVLGMTFEVYDRETAIQVDPLSGRMSRGKASLQVTNVAATTSTCKIIRAVPGRPVVRDDVIANAVYDPKYVFKFLIHGRFDVDGDGRPSAAEAQHLRSRVIRWGGAIVTGDDLPGDLDFLVLGAQPPIPGPLATQATDRQTEIWIDKRNAYEKYQELMKQAMDAQIPVLNANRFFILIGHTIR